jgi:hypothetical protein
MRWTAVMMVLGCLLFATPGLHAQDEQPTDNPDFMVEASVTNETPFVGEEILYVFRYYAYVMPSRVRDDLPGFEGFWQSNVYVADNFIRTVNGQQYNVGELYVEITPLEPGRITIEPAVFEVPQTVFREEVNLATEPVTVDVRPLPPDAPDEFNGAVGQFHAEFEVDQRTVTLGEPVRQTVTVSGTGNLSQLPAPGLPELPGWRVYSNPVRFASSSVSSVRLGEKIFEWLLIPEETGTQTLPPVIFSFFDPQLEEYRSLVSPSFTVDVFPGGENIRELPQLESPGDRRGRPAPPLKPLPASLNTGSSGRASELLLLWLFPPGLALICGIWVYQRRRYQDYRRRNRQQTALQRAAQRLRAAGKLPPREASGQITEAIFGYLADKAGCARADLGREEIRSLLDDHGITADTAKSLIDRITEAESIAYIPEGMQYDISPLVKQLVRLLTNIDQSWRAA